MNILITGVAGFIGSNLAKRFLEMGYKVYGIDNLSRGSKKNLSNIFNNSNFLFQNTDLSNIEKYRITIRNFSNNGHINEVWHMAANSDIAAGIGDSNIDLRDTYLTTHNSLILMKEMGIKKIYFASSSAIYGDFGSHPIAENIGPLLPISNYGAMKLASEAAISAAVESFLEKGVFFRFPNVVGQPATHGIIFDLVNKLGKNPKELHVLGNGNQKKIYLHIDELLNAMIFIANNTKNRLEVFNIGPNDLGVTVKFIAETVVEKISPDAKIIYADGEKGWIGDVPKFSYSIKKINDLGWTPTLSSAAAIQKAVDEIKTKKNK